LVLEHTEVTVEIPDRASEDCRAVSSILARIGDKWSVLIIVLLGDGSKRFNESVAFHRECSPSRFVDWSGTAW
jgi:DNA-binding HxlR family transcriptional regulator